MSDDPRTVEVMTVVHPSGAVLKLYAEEQLSEADMHRLTSVLTNATADSGPWVIHPMFRVEVLQPAPAGYTSNVVQDPGAIEALQEILATAGSAHPWGLPNATTTTTGKYSPHLGWASPPADSPTTTSGGNRRELL